MIEEKIKLTRAEISKQKLLELKRRHRQETHELEHDMKAEHVRFIEFEKDKFSKYQAENKRVEEDLLRLHRDQLAEYREQLSCKLPIIQRETGNLLALKRLEEQMVRQKQYESAQQIRGEIVLRRREQIERSKTNRMTRVRALLKQLEERQALERNVLAMRTEESLKLLAKDLRQERDKMLLRHKNIRSEMRAQQERECLQIQGRLVSRPLDTLSKTSHRQ